MNVINNSAIHHLSPTLRVARSRHTGQWIVEELNTVYGYWATIRMVTRKNSPEEVRQFDIAIQFMLRLPAYSGPKHEAAERFDSCTICG